jgi:hypothetical protein
MLAALVQDKQGCKPKWRKSNKAFDEQEGKLELR